MINALGPPGRGQDGEDEVLDAVGEVGKEEGASGLIRWIPRMGTLELFCLKRKSMRNSPPLVPSVSPRNGHKVLILLVSAHGSPQPASQT